MATIKAIESSSVHQIQSGQVIVDLCSVVKELVENSLDAGATSIEVRFKNQGLDAIEVQDNGRGIAPEDFETIALKHYTSKLSSYEDLSTLDTFGFRGEALSSLCALSKFHILTARSEDGAVGKRLDFEVSGKLQGASVAAAPTGTTVFVEQLFYNLPVRRKELEKNIKREYGKVVNLMHAYACIGVGVRFSASNQMPKGKKAILFSTKSNPTTKENILNVFGTKTMLALVGLDLRLEMEPSHGGTSSTSRKASVHSTDRSLEVHVLGHISKPVFGEGRQAPDRQMFFVNSRPCLLPQVAKAFNEVYKSFNVSQSPFIFANLVMDTNTYDVNVSPDKRTILLHEQANMLEQLKIALTELFESTDHTVPLATLPSRKLPGHYPLTVSRQDSSASRANDESGEEDDEDAVIDGHIGPSGLPSSPANLIQKWVGRGFDDRKVKSPPAQLDTPHTNAPKKKNAPFEEEDVDESEDHSLEDIHGRSVRSTVFDNDSSKSDEEVDLSSRQVASTTTEMDRYGTDDGLATSHQPPQVSLQVHDFNNAIRNARSRAENHEEDTEDSLFVPQDAADIPSRGSSAVCEEPIPSFTPRSQVATPGPVPSAFDRMRPKRMPPQVAEITVGDYTTTAVIGSGSASKKRRMRSSEDPPMNRIFGTNSRLTYGLRRQFAAPGSQLEAEVDDHSEEIMDVEDGDEGEVDAEVDDQESRDSDADSQGSANGADMMSIAKDDTSGGPQWSGTSAAEEYANSPETVDTTLRMDDDEDDTDGEYVDEAEKKAQEDQRVSKLTQEAEEVAAAPTDDNLRRATQALKNNANRKDSTLQLLQTLDITAARVEAAVTRLKSSVNVYKSAANGSADGQSAIVDGSLDSAEAESRLSLTVVKSDFDRMRIAGQFNLGFVLATRPAAKSNDQDDLFIIDQHAADEKYNYERLQRTVTLQSQRLVHPKLLELTAVEEEIILNHPDALRANGFEVEIVAPVSESTQAAGRHCQLLTLPMSREKTFETSDLEELLHLLSEQPSGSTWIPRPRKVQTMLAMRACRSSIMVGKTLTIKQMERVVRNMGEMEKPWNCPHGRPTMRHLAGLSAWSAWNEGDTVDEDERDASNAQGGRNTDWNAWLQTQKTAKA